MSRDCRPGCVVGMCVLIEEEMRLNDAVHCMGAIKGNMENLAQLTLNEQGTHIWIYFDRVHHYIIILPVIIWN